MTDPLNDRITRLEHELACVHTLVRLIVDLPGLAEPGDNTVSLMKSRHIDIEEEIVVLRNRIDRLELIVRSGDAEY